MEIGRLTPLFKDSRNRIPLLESYSESLRNLVVWLEGFLDGRYDRMSCTKTRAVKDEYRSVFEAKSIVVVDSKGTCSQY